eukprot:s7686_g4.t1
MGPRKVDVGAVDDGCGGACGALCFEADAEAGRTEERWAYVGAGQGTYRQTAQMDYVGHGPSRDGLTKTIVTGVTQHIGHGHVHVIHHVHHYSTSSHDVDDLPDVIGDDDASLPHGHVHVIHHVHHYSTSSHDVDDLPDVIGDDDASLPPEYRHGDVSTYDDDDSVEK